MTAREATLVGAMLDHRYEVQSLLARGGMSAVYRGIDTRLHRPVAIKVMDKQYAADRSWAERFEQEARAAASLHHPNVVAVHDQGVDQSGDSVHAFLVMELVDGGTLRDLLERRGKLDPALAISITEQVLSALSVAHQADLVHRDIKPENVLIGRTGSPGQQGAGIVKVADFGLVRALASAGTTSSSVILGTVAYLSPEQVETGVATTRSDVYSVGLLLYEMLTGAPAFSGDTALSVAYQHVNADVPAPSASNPLVPAALDGLVRMVTSRRVQDRPADATAMLTELRRVRDTLGLTPVPIPALPPPDAVPDDDRTIPAMAPITPTSNGATGAPANGAHANGAPANGMPHDGAPPHAPGGKPINRTQLLDHPDEAFEERPRRRIPRFALVTAALLAIAGLVAGGMWVYNVASQVTVPDVQGMTLDRAKQVLAAAELTPSVVEQRHNTVGKNTAIGTDPAAGTELPAGEHITLVMSLGRPAVPDIEPGTSREDAVAAIERAQLTAEHDPSIDEYHESIAEGAILGVAPSPGTPLKIGETVTYALSKGPPPTPVPNVAGESRDEAFSILKQAGFEPYDAGEEFSPDVAAGYVVRTDPEAGTTPSSEGLRVGVYVSNAVEVPSVSFQTLDEAQQILADAGLTAEVVQGGTSPVGSRVFRQQPSAGERVESGSTVQLWAFP
ncbi:MAG: PASTA domain-containing protein [Actinophytocola sp.]|nr:PASTA domain-containing protein [Actinophytocola sp.]